MNVATGAIAQCALALWALTLWGAIFTAWRRGAAPKPSPSLPPPTTETQTVAVVRPCTGDDPALLHNLLSITQARGLHPSVRVLHLVAHDDKARGIAFAAAETLRAHGIEAACLITHPQGANHKVAQLAEATAHPFTQSADIWTCVDCDVDLDGFNLDALWLPFAQDAQVAATWAPFCEQVAPAPHPHRFAARVSEAVLNGSLHSFPLLVGLDPHTVVGKVLGIRTCALQTLGGWDAFADYLGEDMQLGIHLRAQGSTVQTVCQVARARTERRDFASVFQRYVRWLLVIRGQRPALLMSYPLVFFPTFPLMVGCLVLATHAPTPTDATIAMLIGALAATGRLTVAALARLRCGDKPTLLRAVSDSFLADGILCLATARAVFSRQVAWRGRPLRVQRGGKLAAVPLRTNAGTH